ncbi:GTP-binding protein GEM [Garra rufa]|uniref:GTP-binding protein GEM n=1 Tax=Garra rufa TaxID=137080 RepID=UPI003CCE9801
MTLAHLQLQNITSFSYYTGVILVHSSSGFFHSSDITCVFKSEQIVILCIFTIASIHNLVSTLCPLFLFSGEVFEQTITVDGERATVTLLDTWDSQDEGGWTQEQCLQTGDAFIIVYAITDRSSFLRAADLRIQLRSQREADRTPIILVGNKCDLVRCREVSISEGRASAAVFDCKFIETSAAMQHNVWPLFEGIIRQLRLRRDSTESLSRRCSLQKRRESLPKKAKRFINRLVAKKNKQAAFKLKSKSCHDLMSL